MAAVTATQKLAIVPGIKVPDVYKQHWYGWLQRSLDKPPKTSCVLKNMPFPMAAPESEWVPFMKSPDGLGCDSGTIIIGHSSGASAAMRYAEAEKVKGLVLVSAATTDQNDPVERASGYFNRPWQFEKIRENAGFIIQFASDDDHFIPISEQMEVAEGLKSELHRFTDRGHFLHDTEPELLQAIEAKL
ncbi:putative hydrolase RBBP9 [Dunaliella salina]|uniref:Hydrolase RBBP9 n=1 Tax=Dunaliella salina TaxID=3046 RepID=A0ABQ7GZM9_DUNSA|nr:putative hydrolase RBBP9 [Dunaliella salina]|eukprot:KAF5840068.1 putative hydrolase RBBP9 [Dunaliella salina]